MVKDFTEEINKHNLCYLYVSFPTGYDMIAVKLKPKAKKISLMVSTSPEERNHFVKVGEVEDVTLLKEALYGRQSI